MVRAVFAALSAALVIYSAADASPDGKDSSGGWSQKKNEEGKVVQELKIEAPTFTEEDQYGYIMPQKYRCDSCKAVMYHVEEELKKRQPKSRRLKNWEYTDILDETCRSSFQGYGIKLIDGENTLSGPGLMQNEAKIAPGSGAIQMGGESWTKRLAEICREIVYEKVGEDEIYDLFYTKASGGHTEKLETLCTTELRHCTTGPRQPPARPRPEPRPRPRPRPRETVEASKKAEAKKDKKATASTPKKEPKQKPAAGSSGERLDAQSFLRSLAVKHGLTSDEYLTARTEKEWEQLVLAVAGRIYSRGAGEL